MPLEIERKFLLAHDGWKQDVTRQLVMRQGYLGTPGGRASVRVRIEGDTATLNIKASVVGSARAEYEYTIPVGEAEQMLATLCVGRVEKTRHYVEREGLTWEIDAFEGDNAGLVVAEIELDAVDQAFSRPDWLGPEVTDDSRYYNHALAMKPFSAWSGD